jgi:uncharacterized protein (DUF952 family)
MDPGGACIYKIMTRPEWEAAQSAGRFAGSEADRGDGFIHFSGRDQVAGTAARYFAGCSGLILLTVDPRRVTDLRWEQSGNGIYPHLYAVLDLDAVIRVDPLPDDVDAADAVSSVLM